LRAMLRAALGCGNAAAATLLQRCCSSASSHFPFVSSSVGRTVPTSDVNWDAAQEEGSHTFISTTLRKHPPPACRRRSAAEAALYEAAHTRRAPQPPFAQPSRSTAGRGNKPRQGCMKGDGRPRGGCSVRSWRDAVYRGAPRRRAQGRTCC
jgi:hypothetical protein